MQRKNRLGIALGSGSARGWAHIGILRALEQAGIVPDVIAGTSIGALVGAAYASGRLDRLEEWVTQIDWWEIIRYMDLRRGGVEGERLMRAFRERVDDVPIESLTKPFGAVATDLHTGREVWFQDGSLLEAVRASIALPGLFSPVRYRGRWLVDGGLVDPLPVSLCRAMGADRVIAVNLNGDIVGKHFGGRLQRLTPPSPLLARLSARLQAVLGNHSRSVDDSEADDPPGLFEVMAGSINIMQDRITRARLAGDPPAVALSPRLAHLGLMDFDQAGAAITAGMDCVRLHLPLLRDVLDLPDVANSEDAAPSPAGRERFL
ncbi:patatin-like phospholipase RssA [Candidatus Contendibacter odensensis]|uniref:Esterase of the alpha-beta hydrolase superfamily n=1 Tax=Candidatus Contendobacter odensis Run_B_J11 TaxID=1400861 RepID=A0A7U7J3T6_9GAMM|nr:patatin-like phospholipase RssA [Candidatus Contendobacter odensis]CDH45528.1 putative esterase of the alpha-beta hydrolase superfamily [Candidatus Contendobacter odensis Run_B_J11]